MELEMLCQRVQDICAVSVEIEISADDTLLEDVIDVKKTLNCHQQREGDDVVLEGWSERSRNLVFSEHCAEDIPKLVLSGRDCDEMEVRESTHHDSPVFHEFISAILLTSVACWVMDVCLAEPESREKARLEVGSILFHDDASSEEGVFRSVVRLKIDMIDIRPFTIFRVFTFLLTLPFVERSDEIRNGSFRMSLLKFLADMADLKVLVLISTGLIYLT